jgi:hypothetical protein
MYVYIQGGAYIQVDRLSSATDVGCTSVRVVQKMHVPLVLLFRNSSMYYIEYV